MNANGIHIEWLPANQAWLVMWLDQRLAGPYNDRAEAEQWLSDHGIHDWSVTR